MMQGTAESYRVFVRNWWRWEPAPYMPTGKTKVPDPGARKHTLDRGMTEEEALAMAQEWNRTHKPGPLSRKAEFESER